MCVINLLRALAFAAAWPGLCPPQANPPLHIDPTSPAEGNGSAERPYRSWSQIHLASGRTYLQRRGTTSREETIRLTGLRDVVLGAYGQGGRPKIVSLASERQHAINGGGTVNVTIRDLEVEAAGATSLICFGKSTSVTIDNCVLHGASWGIRITHAEGNTGHKILRTEVYDIKDDGLFIQEATDIEVGYCHVHDVNKNWIPPYTSQKVAAGDGIQFHLCNNWRVHHNVIDRTSSGNKFCFISSNPKQDRGVLENNVFSGPLTTGDGGASVYLGDGANVVVRRNLFKGPSPGGVYSHSSNLKVEENIFMDLPMGVFSSAECEASRNLFCNVKTPTVGPKVNLKDNRQGAPDPAFLRSMDLPDQVQAPAKGK